MSKERIITGTKNAVVKLLKSSPLTTVVASIIAYVYTPVFAALGTVNAFMGAVGVGLAVLVGLATGVGATLGGVIGVLGGVACGAAVLGGVGFLIGGQNRAAVAAACAIGGTVLGGITGGVYGTYRGIVDGYDWSKTALVDANCKVPFNDAVKQACADAIADRNAEKVSEPKM